jgi:hypothetical protein
LETRLIPDRDPNGQCGWNCPSGLRFPKPALI